MSGDAARLEETLHELGFEVINEVCTRFEAAWYAGQQTRIEDFLPPVAPDQNPATLQRLLV